MDKTEISGADAAKNTVEPAFEWTEPAVEWIDLSSSVATGGTQNADGTGSST